MSGANIFLRYHFFLGHLPSESRARTCITQPHTPQVEPYIKLSHSAHTEKRTLYISLLTSRIPLIEVTSSTIFLYVAFGKHGFKSASFAFTHYFSVITAALIFGSFNERIPSESDTSRVRGATVSGASKVLQSFILTAVKSSAHALA